MTNLVDTLRERVTEPDAAGPESTRGPFIPSSFRSGAQIAGTPWIVCRSLGKGGVGEVFEVEHALLGRRAAFKVLHLENLYRRGLVERMAQEGRLLASLHHSNLVDVFDMGLLPDGRPFLVLELLDGRDLRAELHRVGVFSIPAALDIVTQVLHGLSALHEAAVVHRDVKLENLFLCADGHVEILDLGAAERMGETTDERAPSLGTPRTMAPEQIEGKPVDGRTDLYALGIVLYELLAGRGPFDDVTGLEALRFAHCERIPPPPSQFAPQPIPAEIDALVLRALAKSPDDRFASAEAMAIEIAALRAVSTPAPLVHSSLAMGDTEPSPLDITTPSRRGPTRSRLDLSPGFLLALTLSALTMASLALGAVAGRLLLPGGHY